MKNTVLAVAVLAAAAGVAVAGAVGGKGFLDDKVQAGQFKAYHVNFKGGESATVKVESKDCKSLFLIVYDDKGKLEAFGFGGATSKSATFKPPVKGTYRLVVKSNADCEVSYRISHD